LASHEAGDDVGYVDVKGDSADEKTGKAIQAIGTRRSGKFPVSDWVVYVVLLSSNTQGYSK